MTLANCEEFDCPRLSDTKWMFGVMAFEFNLANIKTHCPFIGLLICFLTVRFYDIAKFLLRYNFNTRRSLDVLMTLARLKRQCNHLRKINQS